MFVIEIRLLNNNYNFKTGNRIKHLDFMCFNLCSGLTELPQVQACFTRAEQKEAPKSFFLSDLPESANQLYISSWEYDTPLSV